MSSILAGVMGIAKVWRRYSDERLWYLLLLAFSLGVGVLSLPGSLETSGLVTLLFYSTLPGYAFVEIWLNQLSRLEKLGASITLSVSFLMGLLALDRTLSYFSRSQVTFLPSSPLPFGVLFLFTLASFAYKLWIVSQKHDLVRNAASSVDN